MSLESVRSFFAEHAPDIVVIETAESSATVALAAAAHGVEPARIAKTLSLRIGDRVVLVVARPYPVVIAQVGAGAFLAGLAVLLWRMPHHRDDDDSGPGAVV